jgi:hypothetical protein
MPTAAKLPHPLRLAAFFFGLFAISWMLVAMLVQLILAQQSS